MIAGIWVLNIFAAAWGTLGLSRAHLPRWWLGLPPVLSAMLIAICTAMADLRSSPGLAGHHVGRVVGLWSGVEGITIGLAVALLRYSGRPNLVVPVIAIIVGLHFFPLAWFMPLPLYQGTGAAMTVVGLVAIFLPPRLAVPVTGLGSAAILWSSSLAVGFLPR